MKTKERFEGLNEAESAARNICAQRREQIYLLRMFKAIPEYFLVVNEDGISEYRGRGVARIVRTYTA